MPTNPKLDPTAVREHANEASNSGFVEPIPTVATADAATTAAVVTASAGSGPDLASNAAPVHASSVDGRPSSKHVPHR